jgi:hypothetical protein
MPFGKRQIDATIWTATPSFGHFEPATPKSLADQPLKVSPAQIGNIYG